MSKDLRDLSRRRVLFGGVAVGSAALLAACTSNEQTPTNTQTKGPDSGASSGCEAGAATDGTPPSGPVVSNVYAVVPLGFTPPKSTLQCPKPGRCIDWPTTIDLPMRAIHSFVAGAKTAGS